MSIDDNQPLYREVMIELPVLSGMDVTSMLDADATIPSLIGYSQVLYEEERRNDDYTKLILYFPAEEKNSLLYTEIFLQAIGCNEYTTNESILKRIDYLEAYKKYYTSFRVGDHIVIVPSWEKESPKVKDISSEDILLYLDPGLAFGTGQHPTTKLCLRCMEKHIDNGMKIIDAGCGSGILSIVALLLKADSVFAFDTDGNAVTACMQNLSLNPNVKGSLNVKRSGFDSPDFITTPADLIIANITVGVLCANVSFFDKALCDSLLLSGVICERRDEFVKTFNEWEILEEEESEGWLLFYMKRKTSQGRS